MEENETTVVCSDPCMLVAKISGIVSEACRFVTDVEEALVLLSAREVIPRSPTSRICECAVQRAVDSCIPRVIPVP